MPQKKDSTTRFHTLDEAVCVSLHTNVLRKGMNPAFLSLIWINSRALSLLLYEYILITRGDEAEQTVIIKI